ncbi:uncharacterized protein BDFB_007081 [Asbolus verrucosus]|uniref:BTB domain-containing protein n=1 Tax=Asbolus verrucosus TaxID=1661398 RepID=A0A482VTS8_ASBVE|nr:uncharacterized protein BDFB_007081 [Asbolus verrucosus]
MANNNFDEILASLQNVQDNSKLLKILINIRKDVDWPKNRDNITKLQEKGSLKEVVSVLQTSKKGIIDVSLSILGNCCLDSRCARDVVNKFNVLPHLNQILKRYPKEDSINGRVFRILGNLCRHRDQWANVIIEKKPQILIHTVKFLKEAAMAKDDGKVSEATITMGVRALREMLNRDTLKALVKTYGTLKIVGMLLIKYGTMWEKTKKGENILVNIIKLLQEYSRYKYYPSIVEMRNTEKGDSIVYLSKILLVAPRQIVKIVMNFLKISQLKSDLPVPEIFDCFIEMLRNDAIIREFNSTCEECIQCLCYLLEHPGNRKNERCGDSIPLLITVLRDLTLQSNNKVKEIECCILIISTLNKCRYNDSLIWEQIRCNILGVINEKLKELVGGVEPLNVSHKSDRRKRKNNFKSRLIKENKRSRLIFDDNNEDFTSPSSSDEETDHFYCNNRRFDYSPASSSESELAMSWTSGLSPESSPRSQVYGISESDSDDYSPVCSEVDTSDFPLPMMEDESPTGELDECSEEIREVDDNLSGFGADSASMTHVKVKLVTKIIELLKTYAKLKPPIAQLGTPELLLRLILSMGYFEWPFTSSILEELICKILDFHDHLLPLMQSDFIPIIYDFTKMVHGTRCSKCNQFRWISSSVIKKLTKVAESGVGKGDIAHKLLRGDSATKQQLVLVIPYIVKNKPILVKLMMNCGGLEVLMKLLREESDLQEKSIKVLCVLAAKKLGIPNPKTVKSVSKMCLSERHMGDAARVVTFKLDDGSLLRADRELLSKNSDFFCRLLNGGFKESNEDVITLPNVANKSLGCLVDLIKCDIDKTAPVDIDLDLDTYLDLIALCDRFLMQDYCVYLADCVERFRLSSKTIPVIYHWSLGSRTNFLRVECIAFALVGNIADTDRFEMFRNLFNLGCNEQLVEDIRKLLVRYMTLNESDCGTKKKNGYCDKLHCSLVK